MCKTQSCVRTLRRELRRGTTAKSKWAMELRHSKDWVILNDKLICVTKREVSMQRGEIMWKRHWQNEDGAWEKVRGVAALEGGKKILWNRHWQNEDGAWEKVRGIAALEKKKGGGRGGGGMHAGGLASPGSGEARRKVHLQS